jgi:hypothetical protein
VFASRSRRDEFHSQETSIAARAEGDCLPIPSGDQTAPKTPVRERSAAPAAHRDYQDHAEGPAHPSNWLVAQLNESWRIVDDPLQWILQRRKGSPREKNTGWQGRSFCRTREGLPRCIREHCCLPDQGEHRSVREYRGVEGVALQQVRALAECHIDWEPSPSVELGHDAPFLASAADEMVQ